MRSPLHCGRLLLLALLPALASVALPGGKDAEDQLKSATLLAFLQNAHWADELPANAPLTVGVAGREDFLRRLQNSVDGKSVNGHVLKTLALNAPVDPRCCQVMYFATDKPAEIKPVLESFRPAHVLTIGETEGFLEAGGAVNLFFVDGHMAFEVSLGALQRAGVEISSKLLRFGQIRELPKGRTPR